jgi:hypothetical protein
MGVTLFRFVKFQFLAQGDGRNGMLIDKLVRLTSKNKAEIVEAGHDSFDFLTIHQLDGHPDPITTDPVKELVLNIDLVLDHHLTSSL